MKLRTYVDENRVCISEMARQLDIQKNYLFAVVNARRAPGIHLARRIEQFTEKRVTVDDMIERKPEPERCCTCGKIWKTKDRLLKNNH